VIARIGHDSSTYKVKVLCVYLPFTRFFYLLYESDIFSAFACSWDCTEEKLEHVDKMHEKVIMCLQIFRFKMVYICVHNFINLSSEIRGIDYDLKLISM